MLGFGREGVVTLDSEVCNIIAHQEAAGVDNIVPIQVDARVKVALPVDSDGIMLVEDVFEVDSVVFPDELHTKFVN